MEFNEEMTLKNMETTLSKKSAFLLSAKKKELIFDVITFVFIMLFVYTAASKFMAFDRFTKVLGKSPLLGHFNILLAYLIPITELILSLLLLINKTKRTGLFFSLLLMIVFTLYLVYMVNSGSTLPCLCGGVISSLSWTEHIFFNMIFIALAVFGLRLYKK